MSELMNTQNTESVFRWHLLTTASALALLAAVNVRDAKAADEGTDRPTIWIELGGQLEHAGGQGDPFTPGFVAANPTSPVLRPISPVQAQNPVPFSFAENGKISFQPEDSNWVVSGAVNYGRSSNFKHVDHQTNRIFSQPPLQVGTSGFKTTAENFAETHAHHQESHIILDFSAGKDVGLGMFGKDGSSVLSFGVRFAQFVSSATFDVRARPDLRTNAKYFPSPNDGQIKLPNVYYHNYHATGQASRSFHGIGPSLSWNGTAPVIGSVQNSEVTFDWGANAAILFGRQRARVQHQETARYAHISFFKAHNTYATVYQHPPTGHSGAKTVTVPNVGGFAGASWRIENFKASFGYRADFFFGAMDGGIDTRKNENVGFYGPFATVSIGIGG